MKVVSVEEMQRIEAESNAAGHSYATMMEQAGRAVAEAIEDRVRLPGKQLMVLVGPGNNGGDGLVAARHLSQAGADVTCYLYKARDPAKDENYRAILEADVRSVLAADDDNWRELGTLSQRAEVIIDALLGTGTRLPLRGTLAKTLDVVGRIVSDRRTMSPGGLTSLIPGVVSNGGGAPLVVGVDGPTGLAYETGEVDAVAIPADVTVTFAYPKIGHFRFPGAAYVGELVVADIGTDPSLAEAVALEVVTPSKVRGWLPNRAPDAHKGTFGKAMIVAGSVNYTGAAYLAGAAATRAGAGLVTLALPSAIHSSVSARLAEATYVLLPHTMGVLSSSAANVLSDAVEGYDVVLVGPGLGREEETAGFLEKVLGGREAKHALGFLRAETPAAAPTGFPPLVIDADGLNVLAEWENWPRYLPPQTILTPHPGEMARLTDSSVAEVQGDRVEVARSRALEWGQVIVLKGAYTIVAGPSGRTALEPFANPGLATAGTGDVLAGTIAALRAQGLGAFEAAACGAYLHGLAGEIAREESGAAGMVAGDVLACLPKALKRVGVA